MTPALDIRGSGTAWAIFHQGRQVGGPYTSHNNAISAERGVAARLAPATVRFRKCSSCRTGFMASGKTPCCPDCRKGD